MKKKLQLLVSNRSWIGNEAKNSNPLLSNLSPKSQGKKREVTEIVRRLMSSRIRLKKMLRQLKEVGKKVIGARRLLRLMKN